jgi:hypothetical protein
VFATWCENIGRQVLIWPSDVLGIVNIDRGIVVRLRCLCGNEAEMLTGASSGVRLTVHLAPAA